MPKLKFEIEEITAYINREWDHIYHQECVDEAQKMAVHADGKYPTKLIEERRPNEPLEVKEYREKIWIAKTKPTFTRVYNSLQKIRRSSDWSIKYPEQQLAGITDKESLEAYCEKDFPYFASVTNWVFQVMLRYYLIDPNGVVMLMPLETDVKANERVKPFPYIFDSCFVIDFVPEDYAVLKNPTGCKYKSGKSWVVGESYYFVTTTSIERWDQVSAKRKFELVMSYEHNLNELPVIPWKGSMVCHHGSYMKYESRIAGMLPELDEAVREYSDLQAAKVLHIYPERWEYTQNECTKCKGLGERRETDPSGNFVTSECTTCQGRGYIAAGPYSKIMVRPVQGLEGAQQIPNPPAGYVEKDVEIIKLQEAGIEAHIYSALAAVNMEFLANAPLTTSGISKAEDRDEAGNTASSVAEDIVAFMDYMYDIIARYRYQYQYPNKIQELLPSIAVPEKFDLITATDIGEQMKLAKDANANPTTINAMQVEYAHKKFAQEPKVRDMVALTIKLDPLAGIIEGDKMIRLSNKGISQLTYIISSNIQKFVQQALEDDPKFADKPTKDQKVIIETMAQELLTEQEAEREKLLDGVQPDSEANF